MESSSPPSTAATPPCAQRVADWLELALGEHADPQARLGGGPHGRGQAGHAAAQDEQVEVGHEVVLRSGPCSSASSARSGRFVDGRFRVDVHDERLRSLELGVLVVGVGDDDDLVAGMHEPGGGAVEADLARAARDGVGLEAGAVVDVERRATCSHSRMSASSISAGVEA